MKTLQEQYNLIQEGKGHKDVFMKSARRLFPEYITNFATFQEATKILKQKSILSEAVGGIVTQTSANPFVNWEKFLNEEANESKGDEVDYDNMHNVELNATYKEKFGVKDTKGLTRNKLIKALKSGKAINEDKENAKKFANEGKTQKPKIKVSVKYAKEASDAFRKAYSKMGKMTSTNTFEFKNADVAEEFAEHLMDYIDIPEEKITGYNLDESFVNEGKAINEAKAEEKKPTKEVVDTETKGYDYKDPKNTNNLNFEEMLRGYYAEMKDPKNADKTEEQLREMVAKNLAKDPSFYVKDGAFGIKGVGYTDDVPGLKVSNKELKGEYASSGMEKVKMNESKNSSLNEGWMDLLTYGPLAITAALSALSLATDTPVKDMPSNAKDEVSNFDLKSILAGIKAKWREYTNPKVYKVIQKIVNDPEIVSAAETLILGPRGGKRKDLTNQAYLKALEAKLTPQEINTLKKFLEKIKKEYEDFRNSFKSPIVRNPGPHYNKAKSIKYLKRYAAGGDKKYRAGDYLFEGKKTKAKKETTESKLAEIEKQGRIVTMEAQIEALNELINSKTQRLSMISEDEDLSEIADKNKIKEMQREVKELQKRKMKMEKLYEKMCGKSYSKPEIVDEEVDSDTMSKAEKGNVDESVVKENLKDLSKMSIEQLNQLYQDLEDEMYNELSMDASGDASDTIVDLFQPNLDQIEAEINSRSGALSPVRADDFPLDKDDTDPAGGSGLASHV